MTLPRLLAAFCLAALLATALPTEARPGPGGHRPSHGHWHGGHGHHGHWGSGWAWGLGLGLGLPLALGWYDPYWGYAGVPLRTWEPAYRSRSCLDDEDCGSDGRFGPIEPATTTQAPAPAGTATAGGPTQRPLHLNYCDSARAWYPAVAACPEGWRHVAPQYR
ncbi:MAG TPA: hypothetical protein PLD37_11190 [Usitatibacteraceae bacterium]|nr:hypothetical protein [Usitatibacteraceae bacterium]